MIYFINMKKIGLCHRLIGLLLFIFVMSAANGSDIEIIDFKKARPSKEIYPFNLSHVEREKRLKEICGEDSFGKNEIFKEFERSKIGHNMIWIARSDYTPQGPGAEKKFEMKGLMLANIEKDHIYIEYLCSGQKGGGRELLESLYKHIKVNRYPRLIKLTSLPNAERFYIHMGFTRTYGDNYSLELK